jgi:hypothetical protein
MQTQPTRDAKTGVKQRARQAALVADDTFKGGETPRQKLPLTSPWNMGMSRLFAGRRSPETGR